MEAVRADDPSERAVAPLVRASTVSRIVSATKKTACKSTALVMLAILVQVLLLTTIILTRPTQVQQHTLVDAQGDAVATASYAMPVSLADLAAEADAAEFDAVDSITLPLAGGRVGLRVVGWRWFNSSDMDFLCEAGHTLHIHDGSFSLLPTPADPFGEHPELRRRRLSGATTTIIKERCSGDCTAWKKRQTEKARGEDGKDKIPSFQWVRK